MSDDQVVKESDADGAARLAQVEAERNGNTSVEDMVAKLESERYGGKTS